MAIEPSDLLIPAIHIVTLLITATSAIYVYRQKTTDYPQVRRLLVMVHLFYMGVVSLEFARTFVPAPPDPIPAFTQAFLTIYTIFNTSFVLADVLLLTLVAVAIYYRPNGKNMMDIIREVDRKTVNSTEEYRAAISAKKKGQTLLLLIVRGSKPIYVAVDVP